MNKALVFSAVAAAMLAISGCSKKPVQIEWKATSQSINNALLEERYSFVPKDKKLKESNWAYEVEAQAKGDYLFENNQMVKVFLLAHNADKIIILGEKNLALQYRNYFKANGVIAYIDVQPVDLARGLRDRVKIMFFSSKATLNDNKEVNPLIINPIEEPTESINSSEESVNGY
ncbi:hypothetical protein BKN38_05215 [Helicobacter sp. CLO-3]|uniref:cag pathogenicity island Cag12 family protein n=1 Tax=unclassified Helicobacter TaxID=2593540 RepID=UPI000805E2A9|nr:MULTISPECIES: cag pathogenicity island Cag12 family protein [unclassified Helicobacter]OBV30147.1 hypothetical protein BA723_02590 [Helicobacter sp. CLO-3]OHU83509.1 hypothetical protein BKN38_05215 [Helicobacter sp. CLO-3]